MRVGHVAVADVGYRVGIVGGGGGAGLSDVSGPLLLRGQWRSLGRLLRGEIVDVGVLRVTWWTVVFKRGCEDEPGIHEGGSGTLAGMKLGTGRGRPCSDAFSGTRGAETLAVSGHWLFGHI